MARPASLDRPLTERATAWLYTGPLGHLWSAVADISVLWARWMTAKARRRAGYAARRVRTAARRP